jgi:methylated-DNA-[protein]-cysteine S-methyltransferase
MSTIQIQYYNSEFGELILGGFEGRLCLCDWRYRKNRAAVDTRIKNGLQTEFSEEEDRVTSLARLQLEEYFGGRRKTFDLPLLMVGTDFQKKVWEELLKIPYGKTLTYAQLSERLRNPLGIRAIATANGANALSIIVPCHRIIGAKGEMVGYAGGTRAKEKLLQLEQSSGIHQLELFG